MGNKVCISLAILALVLLVGPGAKAAAFVGAASIDAVAVRQLMPAASMKLEDGVAPELSVDLRVHRRVLANVGQSVQNAGKPSCIGSCPAHGGSYTRPCYDHLYCRHYQGQ